MIDFCQVLTLPGWLEPIEKINVYLRDRGQQAILVIEDFVLPYRVPGPAEAKHTLRLIGALELYAALTHHELAYIMPSETKAFGMKRLCDATKKHPDELRALPHACDALRVALAFWCKRKIWVKPFMEV